MVMVVVVVIVMVMIVMVVVVIETTESAKLNYLGRATGSLHGFVRVRAGSSHWRRCRCSWRWNR